MALGEALVALAAVLCARMVFVEECTVDAGRVRFAFGAVERLVDEIKPDLPKRVTMGRPSVSCTDAGFMTVDVIA